MTSLIVVSEANDGVVRLTLNRPEKRNALSVAMRDEMSEALERLSGDQEVRVLVITGAGSAFCAGFDLSELRAPVADNTSGGMSRADQFHQAILRFPVPVVAAINGPALAGGFDRRRSRPHADLRRARRPGQPARPRLARTGLHQRRSGDGSVLATSPVRMPRVTSTSPVAART